MPRKPQDPFIIPEREPVQYDPELIALKPDHIRSLTEAEETFVHTYLEHWENLSETIAQLGMTKAQGLDFSRRPKVIAYCKWLKTTRSNMLIIDRPYIQEKGRSILEKLEANLDKPGIAAALVRLYETLGKSVGMFHEKQSDTNSAEANSRLLEMAKLHSTARVTNVQIIQQSANPTNPISLINALEGNTVRKAPALGDGRGNGPAGSPGAGGHGGGPGSGSDPDPDLYPDEQSLIDAVENWRPDPR